MKIHKVQAVSKVIKEPNKKPRYCKCLYTIEPGKDKVWCEKCKADQKHGRWK